MSVVQAIPNLRDTYMNTFRHTFRPPEFTPCPELKLCIRVTSRVASTNIEKLPQCYTYIYNLSENNILSEETSKDISQTQAFWPDFFSRGWSPSLLSIRGKGLIYYCIICISLWSLFDYKIITTHHRPSLVLR